MEKKFITVSEAADYLGMSKGYLYQLLFKKKVPYYSPSGRKVLFKVSELDKWIESGRISTQEEINAEVERTLAH